MSMRSKEPDSLLYLPVLVLIQDRLLAGTYDDKYHQPGGLCLGRMMALRAEPLKPKSTGLQRPLESGPHPPPVPGCLAHPHSGPVNRHAVALAILGNVSTIRISLRLVRNQNTGGLSGPNG